MSHRRCRTVQMTGTPNWHFQMSLSNTIRVFTDPAVYWIHICHYFSCLFVFAFYAYFDNFFQRSRMCPTSILGANRYCDLLATRHMLRQLFWERMLFLTSSGTTHRDLEPYVVQYVVEITVLMPISSVDYSMTQQIQTSNKHITHKLVQTND